MPSLGRRQPGASFVASWHTSPTLVGQTKEETKMRHLARWCVTHRLAVIAIWLVVLVGSVFVASSTGSNYSSGSKLSGTQSATAQNLPQRASPAAAGDS